MTSKVHLAQEPLQVHSAGDESLEGEAGYQNPTMTNYKPSSKLTLL